MRASRTFRGCALALAAIALGCSGSSSGGGGSAAYSQADLAGTWRYTILMAGTGVDGGMPGWARGTLSIDAAGAATVETYADSSGVTTVPAIPPTTYAIDGDGVVTATTTLFRDGYGKMDPRKTLFAVTATQGTGATLRMRLAVYQRVVAGTSYAPADLASSTFQLRRLASGTAPTWMAGRVVVGADGGFSLTGLTGPSGPLADQPSVGTLSIAPDGTVSTTASTSYAAYASADKQTMFATQGAAGQYLLSFLSRAGATYAQPDLAGAWHYVQLAVGSGVAAWAHGTVSFDAAGTGTFGPAVDSTGATQTPTPVSLVVASDGVVTRSGATDFSGVLAPDKNVFVATQTQGVGVYGMIVAIR